MRVHFKVDDLSDPRIHSFLKEHMRDMHAVSPPQSIHALDINDLRDSSVTFWSAWFSEQLIACGALKRLNATHAEIKSMRVSSQHRGNGIASKLLRHILETANKDGYDRLSLETGSMVFFDPARRLYEKFGFEYCEPFANYKSDPNSVFMSLYLKKE